MHGYYKIFKDILSQILYKIHEKLLMQWFVAGLLHKIRVPLRMHKIPTYEDSLKKSQRFKFEDHSYILLVNERTERNQKIEENIKMMHKTIRDISMRNIDLWCTLCMTKGNTKDTCWHRDDRVQDVRII